jgi:glycine betaine/proline transport system ATP-binding protein
MVFDAGGEDAVTQNGAIEVECEGLWKIFGARADEALQAVQSENLGKDEVFERFSCVVGVADASFQVRKGEIFCIMGLSGSGKSTVLRHVNRLIEPTAGKVLVEGVDVMELSPTALRKLRAEKIGMVFQHMALWPHRTIRDNVAYGLEVRKVDVKTRREAAEKVLAQVKLAGWGGRYPDELSGGMQQRVGLARAMAADPEILLMDEPFSALDPLIRRDLQDEFLALSRVMRKTTLFITHDLEEAIRMGDRIAIMKDGRIVQTGTPEEIVLKPEGDYVSRFVGGISTLRYVTADEIMIAAGNGADGAKRVSPSTPVAELVGLVTTDGAPVAVVDGERILGTVGRDQLLEALRRDLARE